MSSLAALTPAVSDEVEATSALETELAALLVDVLHLETDAAKIAPEQPLFGEGLGLDSIDALEIALAVSKRYGVNLRSDDARNTSIFANLRSLAAFIATHRAA